MIGTAMSNNGINVQTITFTGNLIPKYPAIYSSIPTGVTLPKPTIFVFDQNFQNPKVQQANLGFEQQLLTDFSVGVTYQYVKGDDLPRSRDVNVSGPTTITANIAAALSTGSPLSGIISYQTGQPCTPNVNSDLNNDGNATNDIAPGFRRNSFRYPAQFSVDPRITKEIPIFGTTKLQLIAEAFNLLNKHNVVTENRTFYSYNSTTTTLTHLAAFGTPTATSGQRIV